VDEVYYLPDSPWPTTANGEGYTLELLAPELDNSLPENWAPINLNGSPDRANVLVNTADISTENFKIFAYPNPFYEYMNLAISLQESAEVHVKIYDQNGRAIQQIEGGYLNAGKHFIKTDLGFLNTGVYYAKIFVDDYAPRTLKWVKL